MVSNLFQQHELTISQFASAESLVTRLLSCGLSQASAKRKAEQFVRVAHTFIEYGTPPNQSVYACHVPGRIEVLGKHTDYAGGRSLLVAADRGFCLIAVPLSDPDVQMTDVASGCTTRFVIDADLAPLVGHWSNYPMTVARRIARNFPGHLRGARIAFLSDLPPAAGMSSSSAMMIATFLALVKCNELFTRDAYRRNIDSPEALAGYAATIENGATFGTLEGDTGVGTFGGSEDHTAIFGCQVDTIAQYRFCPVRFEQSIAMPDGLVWAIGSSGISAEKTGPVQESFNRASQLASAVTEIWRGATGYDDLHLATAIQRSADAPQRIRDVLANVSDGPFTSRQLLDRFEHFITESEQIIPEAVNALTTGDLDAFGALVDRSQALAESLLGNQVPQTIHLASSARQLEAIAASAFGAGFGGSVWALVKADRADQFLGDWSRDYGTRFPEAASGASFFTTRTGQSAFAVPGS